MSGCLLSHRCLSFTPCPALSLLALRIFFYAGYSGARPSGTGDSFSCRNVCVPAPASLRCEALFVRKCYGARPLMLEILFRAGMYVFRRSTSWHWRSFFVPECMCSGVRPLALQVIFRAGLFAWPSIFTPGTPLADGCTAVSSTTVRISATRGLL